MWKKIAAGARGGVAVGVQAAKHLRSAHLRLGVAALALVMCQCAVFRPLVLVSYPSDADYPAAKKRATKLITEYKKRIDGASGWLVARRIAEALTAGGTASAIFGARPEDENENAIAIRLGGGVALAGVLFQVFVDEVDMERQKEAYARGAAALNCALATTRKERDAPVLFGAIYAVESGVAAELGFEPSESSPGGGNNADLLVALNEDCLRRLIPAAPAVR